MTEALRGDLENGFVGERAGAGDDADVALLVNVAGGDADAAAAFGAFAGAGRDEAGTVGSDEAGLLAGDGALHADHVLDRNALGDADGEVEAGVNAFEDGVAREWRRYEDNGYRRTRGGGGFVDGVEDRHLVAGVLEELAAFAWRDAGDELGAVVERELGVFGAEGTRDALDEDLGLWRDENGHGEPRFAW